MVPGNPSRSVRAASGAWRPVAVLLGVALTNVAAAAAEIRVTGSDLLGPAFARAIERFNRQEGASVRLDLRGTRPGLEALRTGAADLGLFFMPPGESLAADGWVSRVVGYHPVVVVVAAGAPLSQLTRAQLRALFSDTGKDALTRWGDFGAAGAWQGRPVVLCALAPETGLTVSLFRRLLLDSAELRPTVGWADSVAALESRLVAAENGIGLTSVAPAPDAPLRAVALAATPGDPAYGPTPENLHAGRYPLRLPLQVVFRREDAPALLALLKHLLDEEAGGAALLAGQVQPLPRSARNQLVFELETMR